MSFTVSKTRPKHGSSRRGSGASAALRATANDGTSVRFVGRKSSGGFYAFLKSEGLRLHVRYVPNEDATYMWAERVVGTDAQSTH